MVKVTLAHGVVAAFEKLVMVRKAPSDMYL